MEYYTYFQLEVRDTKNYAYAGEDIDHKVAVRLEEKLNLEYPIEEKTLCEDILCEELKWYDFEEDMKEISKEFPDYLFVLYGEGEERDDNWRAVFYNGVENYAEAHISFPYFNYDEFVNTNKPQGAADQESLTKDE